jgi:hypothetical protein
MRTTMMGAVVLGLAILAGVAKAQLVDPTTGFTVDAATDPVDFASVASGQPGNVGMEANASAIASMQASQAAMQSFMASQNNSPMDNAADNTTNDTPNVVVQSVPRTPKPVITPKGGTFQGSVTVSIADSDAKAVVFYTTDGKKPTTSSAKYAGPIVLRAKAKVEALAFDVSEMPSAVVSKTFKLRL